MPVHDWSRVEPGIFHGFHLYWIAELAKELTQRLPEGYYAYPEQYAGIYEADVLTLESPQANTPTATMPIPITTVQQREQVQAKFAPRQVVVRSTPGDRVVAVVELVSPANKQSRRGMNAFVQKARELLTQGIHLLLIDPWPPTPRDPGGLHELIVEDRVEEPFRLVAPALYCVVAYECQPALVSYLEPLTLGDRWPIMPVFLAPSYYVNVPLEETYQAAWASVPKRWQTVVAG